MSTHETIEIYKVWRIRHTIFQLCHDRGFLVSQKDLKLTYEMFKEIYTPDNMPKRDEMKIRVAHSQNTDDQMYIFFPDDHKIGVKTIADYVTEMQKDSVRRAIIVLRIGMTPSARQAMRSAAPEFLMEDFLESEMLINITEHELVPQHILMTEDEKQDLFNRYKLRGNQLMKMHMADPIARYYGYKRGQIIKIVRKSDTAGRYVTYRIVV